jgi:hypothetical protein
MLVARLPRAPRDDFAPQLQVPRVAGAWRGPKTDAREFDRHESERVERLSAAAAGILQSKQALEAAAASAQLHERLMRSCQSVLTTLVTIQATLAEVPEARRRPAKTGDAAEADGNDAAQARKKALPSLHARIIREAQNLLEANECFLLVRGGGGGGNMGAVGALQVQGVRDALQAARWSRWSLDGSFVEGSPTGIARQAIIEGLINTEYWGPQVLSGIVIAPDQITLPKHALEGKTATVEEGVSPEFLGRIVAAAKKKAPSLQERIFMLKKMPGNAAPAVEAGVDEEMSDVDGDGDAGGGQTHGVSGE